MKGSVLTNFRGMRALVIHAEDTNRQVLVAVLGKLGLTVRSLDPHDPALPAALAACDIILMDADVTIEAMPRRGTPRGIPCIALIGTEAPSHLTRVVRQGCVSHILKPIRNTGVYTALLLAINEHEQRQKSEREIETFRQRLAGRRDVTKAVLALMNAQGIDQDEAYDRLRVAAMNRRIPIDELAREHLAQDLRVPGPDRRPRAEADPIEKKNVTNRRLTQ